jgi:hypothetical protein
MRLYEYTSAQEAPARAIATSVFSSLPAIASSGGRIAGAGVTGLLGHVYAPVGMETTGWTVMLVVFSLAVAGAIWRGPGHRRRQLAAGVLLVLASYGVIAVARSILQSADDSVIAALTRYHYVPSIALTIVLALALAQIAERVPLRLRAAVLVGWYAATLAGWIMLGPTIEHHQSDRDDTREVLRAIRATIDEQPPGATVRIPNAPFRSFPFYTWVPGRAGVFTMFYATNVVDGRQVLFVEPNARVRAAHRHGRRIGRLLVAPEGVGSGRLGTEMEGAAPRDRRPPIRT